MDDLNSLMEEIRSLPTDEVSTAELENYCKRYLHYYHQQSSTSPAVSTAHGGGRKLDEGNSERLLRLFTANLKNWGKSVNLVPKTGNEPAHPLAGKHSIWRVMRLSEKLVSAKIIRLLNFTDQRLDQRLWSYYKSNIDSFCCLKRQHIKRSLKTLDIKTPLSTRT